MSYELSGKLVEKFDTQQVTATFKKREFVIEKKENAAGREFIELIKFQLNQDKCDLVDQFRVDDELNISFNIKGRKWEKDGKVSYFLNLEAWKIAKVAGENSNTPPPPSMNEIPPEMDDDLPF